MRSKVNCPSYWRAEQWLAPFTSLNMGGPAQYFAECENTEQLSESLACAHQYHLPVTVLGGGSNVVIADRGIRGLVLRLNNEFIRAEPQQQGERLSVGAALPWEDVVNYAVSHQLGGVECLSGIPGSVGATPMQNVGAYGQQVSDVIVCVKAVEIESGDEHFFNNAECHFGYRDSRFKNEEKERWVVCEVAYQLTTAEQGLVAYADLRHHFEKPGAPEPSLAAIRQVVRDIRRSKGMLIDEVFKQERSVGSFFTLPIISLSQAEELQQRAKHVTQRSLPLFPITTKTGEAAMKVAAGFLIEEGVGMKGLTRGRVGVSIKHALALVNYGGASAQEIIDLAALVRRRVQEVWGITLIPEPQFLGFEQSVEELLR